MRSTPWSAYTPQMMLELVGFAVLLFLILFGFTLAGVSGFYLVRVVRAYLGPKPFAAFEKKSAAAIQAVDLGWLAIVCGPLLGVLIFLPLLPISLFVGPPAESLLEIPKMLLLMVGVGAIAGLIAAGAFWTSSILFGNFRKAAKRLRGVRDPEFDGPV